MRTIIKRCLLNVIAACKKYKIDFSSLLTEIASDNFKKM
jgi:hypothetical protein